MPNSPKAPLPSGRMVSLPVASITHSHVPECVQPGVRVALARVAAVGLAADAEDAEEAGAKGAAGASTGSDAEGAAGESAVTPADRIAANGSRVMGGGRLGSRCAGRYGCKPQHQHG